jgi:hypothetical protein
MQIDDITTRIEARLKRKIDDPHLRPEEWETAGIVFSFEGRTDRELIRSINKDLDNAYITGRK